MEKAIPKFLGKKAGKIFKFDPGEENRYHAYMHNIKDGTSLYVSIGKVAKFTRRSLEQNAYYWGIVVDIPAQYTGYTPEEMHEAFKIMFLKVKRQGLPDTVRSTATLTIEEMMQYIDSIQKWAATELGCYIPDSDKARLDQ
jgi:hypothetical protein